MMLFNVLMMRTKGAPCEGRPITEKNSTPRIAKIDVVSSSTTNALVTPCSRCSRCSRGRFRPPSPRSLICWFVCFSLCAAIGTFPLLFVAVEDSEPHDNRHAARPPSPGPLSPLPYALSHLTV